MASPDDENVLPTKPAAGDAALTVARAGLSALPLVGGAATELLNAAVASPLQQRRDGFVNRLAERLLALEHAGLLRISELGTNEAFLDVVLHATTLALRTKSAEKRTALRNACLNAALPSGLEEAWQLVFLNLIDRFTEWHIRVLKFANDPNTWLARARISPPPISVKKRVEPGPPMEGPPGEPYEIDEYMTREQLLTVAFPVFAEDGALLEHVWKELVSAELVVGELGHPAAGPAAHHARRHDSFRIGTTQRGSQLISFIEEPTV